MPSIGSSHDLYVEGGLFYSFGGHPKANFALRLVDIPTFGLNVTTVGQGTVAKDPDQPQYLNGSVVRLTATPATHGHFVEWGGDASGSVTPLDVTMDAAKSVTATFAIDTYSLTYTAGPNGTISGTTPQTVNSGWNGTTVTAVPNTG